MHRARMSFAVTALMLVAAPALAHDGHGGHGLAGGLAHPFSGADHMLAMIAVGLFAALRGGRAMWAWPLAFVCAAGLGFASARYGVNLPLVEPMILASVLVLGLLIAASTPVAMVPGIALVVLFGVSHGQAHAVEAGGSAPAFAVGFLIASAALHGAGLALYRILGKVPARAAGVATVAGGLALALA